MPCAHSQESSWGSSMMAASLFNCFTKIQPMWNVSHSRARVFSCDCAYICSHSWCSAPTQCRAMCWLIETPKPCNQHKCRCSQHCCWCRCKKRSRRQWRATTVDVCAFYLWRSFPLLRPKTALNYCLFLFWVFTWFIQVNTVFFHTIQRKHRQIAIVQLEISLLFCIKNGHGSAANSCKDYILIPHSSQVAITARCQALGPSGSQFLVVTLETFTPQACWRSSCRPLAVLILFLLTQRSRQWCCWGFNDPLLPCPALPG